MVLGLEARVVLPGFGLLSEFPDRSIEYGSLYGVDVLAAREESGLLEIISGGGGI